jgi:hypothetical protein
MVLTIDGALSTEAMHHRNVLSIAETLSTLLMCDQEEFYEMLSGIRSIWKEDLINEAAEFLSVEYKKMFFSAIAIQNQQVSMNLSRILGLNTDQLLLELAEIRLVQCQAILRAASRLLTQGEVINLNKIVTLQNIASGGTLDKPWEQKQPRPKPSRPAFSKQLIAKTLITVI